MSNVQESFDPEWVAAHMQAIQKWDEDGGYQPPFSIRMFDDWGYRRRNDIPSVYPWAHQTITTNLTANQRFCAESHCRGQCGFPALVLEDCRRLEGPRLMKLHGSMVACGPCWQGKAWDGEVVYVPQEYRLEKMYSMYWW